MVYPRPMFKTNKVAPMCGLDCPLVAFTYPGVDLWLTWSRGPGLPFPPDLRRDNCRGSIPALPTRPNCRKTWASESSVDLWWTSERPGHFCGHHLCPTCMPNIYATQRSYEYPGSEAERHMGIGTVRGEIASMLIPWLSTYGFEGPYSD